MIFGTSTKDLEEEYVVVRNCHLCGEEFTVERYVADTICPKCKELWQKIINERKEK